MFKLQRIHLRCLITQKERIPICQCYSTTKLTDEEKEKELERIAKEATLDQPPTTCCQSGCAECVYIRWAETIASKMHSAGPEIAQKILQEVNDPSMKAYLELELRVRGITTEKK